MHSGTTNLRMLQPLGTGGWVMLDDYTMSDSLVQIQNWGCFMYTYRWSYPILALHPLNSSLHRLPYRPSSTSSSSSSTMKRRLAQRSTTIIRTPNMDLSAYMYLPCTGFWATEAYECCQSASTSEIHSPYDESSSWVYHCSRSLERSVCECAIDWRLCVVPDVVEHAWAFDFVCILMLIGDSTTSEDSARHRERPFTAVIKITCSHPTALSALYYQISPQPTQDVLPNPSNRLGDSHERPQNIFQIHDWYHLHSRISDPVQPI